MSSELYKKELWINPNHTYLFNVKIVEYDMREAGYSLIKEYKLLPSEQILKLGYKTKNDRTIDIGKIQRDNKEFAKSLSEAFVKARKLFFEENEIEDDDIISIKKDAIFCKKICSYTVFGKYIEFRAKNEYTSYLHLDSTLEFYHHLNYHSVKGIGKENEQKHEGYMTEILDTFCVKMETEPTRSVLNYIRRFIDLYKKRAIEPGYYRTFNNRSEFVMTDDKEVFYDQISVDDLDYLDISYNYFNILMKLIKIPL